MKIRALIFLISLYASMLGGMQGPQTYNPSTCDETTIQNILNRANNNDTIRLPAPCPGSTGRWSSTFNFTKAVRLTSQQPCTLDSKNRPTSCSTNLIDACADGTYMIVFTPPARTTTMRLDNIIVTDGGVRTSSPPWNAAGQGGSAPDDGRRFRIDHNIINQLQGYFQIQWAYGLIDHNVWTSNGGIGLYLQNTTDYVYSDNEWNMVTKWGADRGSAAVYVENNTLAVGNSGTRHAGFTDAYGGSHWVVRYNDIFRAWIEGHGTESPGRSRGVRTMEVYGNNYTGNGTGNYIVNVRSGPVLTWGQTVISGYQGNENAAVLNNERQIGEYDNWSVADGTSPWDLNDAANPQAGPFTVTAQSWDGDTTGTVTVAGTPWQPSQWLTYSIHKQGCTTSNSAAGVLCGTIITDNTNNRITYGTIGNRESLQFAVNDQFTINAVTDVFDGACRSGGSLLVAQNTAFQGLSWSAGIVTITMTGHGYALCSAGNCTGNISVAQASVSGYNNTFPLRSVPDANHITYSLSVNPGGSPASNGIVTKVPWGSSPNNQVTDGCYEWLNSDGSQNLVFGGSYYHNGTNNTGSIREATVGKNGHYYNYGGTPQTGVSTPFTGTPAINNGVGVGTLAQMPNTCTVGVAYWALGDGNWNQSGGALGFGGYSGQGRLYKCTSPDNFTLYYTPYTNPHPLDALQGAGSNPGNIGSEGKMRLRGEN